MDTAYRKGDSSRLPITIPNWQTEDDRQGTPWTPQCLVCDEEMFVKAANSVDTDTHFSHYRNSACPTRATAHEPYAVFSHVARDPSSGAALRAHALGRIVSLHEQTRKIVPALTWKEFLDLLGTAKDQNIWALKNLDPGYLPYILACCTRLFPPSGKTRPHPLYFVLDSGARQDVYWQKSVKAAQVLWRVDLNGTTSRQVSSIPIVPVEKEAWFLLAAKSILSP